MARYVRILTRFWQDEAVIGWSEDVRTLYFYLLTSPHQNIIGLYVLPRLYACADLRWEPERFDAALASLLEAGKVQYDPQTAIVWVVNFLLHNPLENPKQVLAAGKAIDELPRSSVVQAFQRFVEALGKPLLQPLAERIAKRYAISVTVTVTANRNRNRSTRLSSIEEATPALRADPADANSAAGVSVLAKFETDQSGENEEAGKVELVMNHYNRTFTGLWKRPLRLTPDRAGKIRRRLRTYTVEQLCQAITAIRASPYHCGENESHRVYATPEFICRNDGKVDEWLNREEVPSHGRRGTRGPVALCDPDTTNEALERLVPGRAARVLAVRPDGRARAP